MYYTRFFILYKKYFSNYSIMGKTRKNTKANFRKTRRVKGGMDYIRKLYNNYYDSKARQNATALLQEIDDEKKEFDKARSAAKSSKKKAVLKPVLLPLPLPLPPSQKKAALKPVPLPTPPVPPSSQKKVVLKPVPPPPLPPPAPSSKNVDAKTALKRENKIKKWTDALTGSTSDFWKEFFKDDELEKLRAALSEPDLCNCVKPIFYVPTEPSNTVDIALCKLFVIYGIISAKFEYHRYIYNILWKGTRALYLNDIDKETNKESLKTRDLDITLVDRHGYVNEDITNMNRQQLAMHIGELSKSLLNDTHIELLDPSNPKARNKDIVKLSYKSESGEYIPLSDIGCKPTEYQGPVEYLEKTEPNCVAGNDVLYLYPTIDDMEAEKKYYLSKYEQQLVTSSDDSQLKYDINRLKIGLNKIIQIKQELGTDVYEIEKEKDAEYAKEIYDKAVADREERLKLQAIVKEENLTREELQELINSRSKTGIKKKHQYNDVSTL